MNDERRSQLTDAICIIDDAISLIQEISEDEQDSYDMLPDSLQMSCKGDLMQGYIEKMDMVINALFNAQNQINNIIIKPKKNGKIKVKS